MERFLLTTYDGGYALTRVEWSKGWGYTDKAAWDNEEVLGAAVLASFRDGVGPGWDEAAAVLDRLDPHRVFGTALLNRLFPDVRSREARRSHSTAAVSCSWSGVHVSRKSRRAGTVRSHQYLAAVGEASDTGIELAKTRTVGGPWDRLPDLRGGHGRLGQDRTGPQAGEHGGEQTDGEDDRRRVDRGGHGGVAVLADETRGERERRPRRRADRDRGGAASCRARRSRKSACWPSHRAPMTAKLSRYARTWAGRP